jgi:hypothetical protein
MCDPFPTRPAVALATPVTARLQPSGTGLLVSSWVWGNDCLKHGERSVSNYISLPPPSLCHYLPFFIYTFRFLYHLSLILHSSYALSFLSHVPLTCIPSVAYRGGWFGGFKPLPKFRSFDKAETNSLFRGKYIRSCLVFLFHHHN